MVTISLTTDGYHVAIVMTHVLKQRDDDLSRGVLRQALSLKDFITPFLPPGITVNTSPTNYVPIRQFQLLRFNDELGAVWRRAERLQQEGGQRRPGAGTNEGAVGVISAPRRCARTLKSAMIAYNRARARRNRG
jgi:hypothetical protein